MGSVGRGLSLLVGRAVMRLCLVLAIPLEDDHEEARQSFYS